MRQTLFYIPPEVFGLPLFGFGLLLAVWATMARRVTDPVTAPSPSAGAPPGPEPDGETRGDVGTDALAEARGSGE